jgi:hypothetical protein
LLKLLSELGDEEDISDNDESDCQDDYALENDHDMAFQQQEII